MSLRPFIRLLEYMHDRYRSRASGVGALQGPYLSIYLLISSVVVSRNIGLDRLDSRF